MKKFIAAINRLFLWFAKRTPEAAHLGNLRYIEELSRGVSDMKAELTEYRCAYPSPRLVKSCAFVLEDNGELLSLLAGFPVTYRASDGATVFTKINSATGERSVLCFLEGHGCSTEVEFPDRELAAGNDRICFQHIATAIADGITDLMSQVHKVNEFQIAIGMMADECAVAA